MSTAATHAFVGRCPRCRGWRALVVDDGTPMGDELEGSVVERVTIEEARAIAPCAEACRLDAADRRRAPGRRRGKK